MSPWNVPDGMSPMECGKQFIILLTGAFRPLILKFWSGKTFSGDRVNTDIFDV
jgi:hypothetical protein